MAEVWPEDKRTRAAGLLQSAWRAGFLLAAVLNLLLHNCSWRLIFLAGIALALITLLIRMLVKKPEQWVRSRAKDKAAGNFSNTA